MAASAALSAVRPPTLLFLVGSVRKNSLNHQLSLAAENLVKTKSPIPSVKIIGCEITSPLVAQLPLFNQDFEYETGADGEKRFPASVSELKALVTSADGLVIASPEYNGSMTPLLVNALSWTSRTTPGADNEPMYSAFRGKPAAVLATSPGGLGGLRGISHISDLMQNLGCHVVGRASVGQATAATFANSEFANESQGNQVRVVLDSLLKQAGFTANQGVLCEVAKAQKMCGEYGDVGTLIGA